MTAMPTTLSQPALSVLPRNPGEPNTTHNFAVRDQNKNLPVLPSVSTAWVLPAPARPDAGSTAPPPFATTVCEAAPPRLRFSSRSGAPSCDGSSTLPAQWIRCGARSGIIIFSSASCSHASLTSGSANLFAARMRVVSFATSSSVVTTHVLEYPWQAFWLQSLLQAKYGRVQQLTCTRLTQCCSESLYSRRRAS